MRSGNMSPINDQILDHLESAIPELARAATNKAYWDALASGSSVLICEDKSIYEVFPDGSRKFVRPVRQHSANLEARNHE